MERRESGQAGDDGKGHAEAVQRNTYTLVKGSAFTLAPSLTSCRMHATHTTRLPTPGPIFPALN